MKKTKSANGLIEFTIPGKPPRATGQMRKAVRTARGVRFYDPPHVAAARKTLLEGVKVHAPEAPLEGPVKLSCTWAFEAQRKKDCGTWKVTRPDTDNMQKLLKDVMTLAGFWKDDAQVAMETCRKVWTDEPGIAISVELLN
ncbi:RusA family crossover junction endodeoxyribonuclease [Faecalibaculum rodentium]|uniref:RusA family crossover junction endodeoxyribonuclease n=1 Tax=Faecalibaculum rodentium TaxID=1702221 RepID=UPI00272F5560|nr:RusA family crossover junction endodeoxyribonuclease [Faecalibaculum rodentium]